MKMSRKTHRELLDLLKSGIDKSINSVLNDTESPTSFMKITYNKDLTKFDVLVDSSLFSELEELTAVGFYFQGNLYQAFNGVPEDNLKTIVNFIDMDSEELINSCDSSLLKNASLKNPEAKEKETSDSQALQEPPAQVVPAPEAVPAEEVPPEPIDMSGDYIGTISCPLPPKDESYTVYNRDNSSECIALYIHNIDSANFRFHLTRATFDQETFEQTEDLIFKEHIAHYNGDGYYEYIGKSYHLYFKYNQGSGRAAAENKVEVYGLDTLFDQNSFGETAQYKGISGSLFLMNAPFTG